MDFKPVVTNLILLLSKQKISLPIVTKKTSTVHQIATREAISLSPRMLQECEVLVVRKRTGIPCFNPSTCIQSKRV